MKQTTDLFELIKSLSKSEKRYFKLVSSFHEGEKVSIKVFDILESQKKYDERLLKEKLKNEPGIKHLAVVKNRLYYSILSSLESFKKSAGSELKSTLNKIEFLFNKELFKQAEKLLVKAKNAAVEREEFLILLDLFSWETRLIRARSYKGENDNSINNLYNNEKTALEKYARICDYNNLNSQYFIHKQLRGNLRDSSRRKKLQSFASNVFLTNESLANSNKSKSYFLALNASIHFTNKNYKTAYEYGKKLVELLERTAGTAEDSGGSYIHALHNLMIYQFHLNLFKELDSTLQKLRAINPESKTNRMLCFFFASVMEMEVSNYTGEFIRSDKTIKQIDKYLEENKDGLSNKRAILLYHLIAVNLFIRGDYKKALRWTNKILNGFDEGVRTDIYAFMQLFNLVIHFELGNTDLLEYQLSSTSKALNKRNSIYKLESVLLEFLNSSVKRTNQKNDFVLLKEKLQLLALNEEDKTGLEYFDFISWADAKIKNKPMDIIIRDTRKRKL